MTTGTLDSGLDSVTSTIAGFRDLFGSLTATVGTVVCEAGWFTFQRVRPASNVNSVWFSSSFADIDDNILAPYEFGDAVAVVARDFDSGQEQQYNTESVTGHGPLKKAVLRFLVRSSFWDPGDTITVVPKIRSNGTWITGSSVDVAHLDYEWKSATFTEGLGELSTMAPGFSFTPSLVGDFVEIQIDAAYLDVTSNDFILGFVDTTLGSVAVAISAEKEKGGELFATIGPVTSTITGYDGVMRLYPVANINALWIQNDVAAIDERVRYPDAGDASVIRASAFDSLDEQQYDIEDPWPGLNAIESVTVRFRALCEDDDRGNPLPHLNLRLRANGSWSSASSNVYLTTDFAWYSVTFTAGLGTLSTLNAAIGLTPTLYDTKQYVNVDSIYLEVELHVPEGGLSQTLVPVSFYASGERYPWGPVTDIVCESSGKIAIVGQSVLSLSDVAATLSATIGRYGQLVRYVANVSAVVSGTKSKSGFLEAEIASVEPDLAGDLLIQGAFAAAAGSVQLAARNVSGNQAELISSVNAVSCYSLGYQFRNGDLAITIGTVQLTAYFMEGISAELDAVLEDLLLSAGDFQQILGNLECVPDIVGCEIRGSVYPPHTGSVDGPVDSVTLAAFAGGAGSGSVAAQLSEFGSAITGVLPITGSLVL